MFHCFSAPYTSPPQKNTAAFALSLAISIHPGSHSPVHTVPRFAPTREEAAGDPFGALFAQRTPGLAAPRRVASKRERKIASEVGWWDCGVGAQSGGFGWEGTLEVEVGVGY